NGGQTAVTPADPTRSADSNSNNMVITNSYFAGFNDPNNSNGDSQAILVWNGYGPFRIVNNYLEAASENVMFGGGGDPSIRGLIPTNIYIAKNHFYKPLAWMADPTKYVKNLFELKSASYVQVENNVFENNWVNQQKGSAVQFTPRNGGTATWTVVQHV